MKLPHCLSRYAAAGALLLSSGSLALKGQAQGQPPPSSETEAVKLSPFVVSAESDDGYGATESASASRFRQELKNIPQSISILTNQFLKDVAAVDLADVIPMLGGTVSAGARSQDAFTIRGFVIGESYLDGMRDVQEWGGGDFVHIQQLEIIKGPSSNLYANPKGLGGIINRVSKMPKEKQWQQFNLTIGDYANYHFTADVTGPVTANKSLLYRVNAAYRNVEYNRDFKNLTRSFFTSMLEWRVTPSTKVTFFGELMDQDYQEDNFIPSALNSATGLRELTVPDTRRIDEPWVNSRVEKEKARLTVEHHINDNLIARVAAQQTYINNPIEQVEFLSLAANNRTVNRQAFWLNRWEDYTFVEANLYGRYVTEEFEHSFIVAADTFKTDYRSNVRRTPLGTIDLIEPVYNTPKPDFPASGAATNTLGETETSGYSGTYQLNGYDGRLILIGGWRHSKVESSRYAQIGPGPHPLITDPDTKANSPRYGAIIRPWKNVSLYYQYSEVFQPQGAGAFRPDGTPLDPVTGTSEEYGVRLSLLQDRLHFEALKYEIVADGLARRLLPPNSSFFENAGENTSDGYEFTASYAGDNLYVRAGWVTVDVRDTTPGSLGLQSAGQPKYRGLMQVRYKFPKVGSHGGLTIGGGVVHAGERPLSSTVVNGQTVPAYNTFNVHAGYGVGRGLSVSFAVSNLFDKRAIVGNNGILWRPLDPRMMKFTVSKAW